LDSFYLGVAPEKAKGYDFDHPDALDWDLCLSVLSKLLNNEEAEIPIYNFATHSREKHWVKLKPCSLILFEGILSLHDVVRTFTFWVKIEYCIENCEVDELQNLCVL
jgi:uridine kinase